MGTLIEIRKPRQPEKVVRLQRVARWIERMREKGLPNKDLTLYNGAWTPGSDGGAA